MPFEAGETPATPRAAGETPAIQPIDPTAVTAPPGAAWGRAWTDVVDTAIRDGLEATGQQRGLAVVALGSYARRELCPASDIDVLVLHDGSRSRDLAGVVEAVCYPLWDAGLSVGHAVRTGAQAVAAAVERLDTAFSLVERRLVAGDAGLADDLGARATRWLRGRASALLEALAEADTERWARAGDAPGVLEMDLKDGAGGLRDLHGLRWAGTLVLADPGLDGLVSGGVLSAPERRDVAAAGQLLLATRCALHQVLAAASSGRLRPGAAVDRLRLDVQDEVAARLDLPDADALLRRVGLAARLVSHLRNRAWPGLLADARSGRRRRRPSPTPLGAGLVLVDGHVEAHPSIVAGPRLALAAAAAVARHAAPLGRRTAQRLRAALADPLPGADVWDDQARASLLEVLRSGRGAEAALAEADHLGLLESLLPDWPRVRGRPQRNPFHRYDLDTHGTRAVSELADISTGRERDVADGIDEPDLLLLATWLHDVGKAWPGDHSAVGAPVAAGWIRHMGFGEVAAAKVAHLVRHHLLLPDAATCRDLDDPDALAPVAAAAADAQSVDALYLLALADARATGPAASSPWRDDLLRRLRERLHDVLADAAQPPSLGVALARARALERDAADAVDDLAARAGRALSGMTPPQLVLAARLWRRHLRTGAPEADVVPGDIEGTAVLTVVAVDRAGLFADVCGVVAAAGAAVLEARAVTVPVDGGRRTALDRFTLAVDGQFDPDAVAAAVTAAAGGGVDVSAALAAAARRRRVRPPPIDVRPVVAVEVAGHGVTVTVEAADAPALLYRIAAAIAAEGLGVVTARIATFGPSVRDTFVLDRVPADLDAIRDRLRAVCAGN